MLDRKECILVTGGAGYVGSHACKALSQAGYIPVSIDNLVHGHRESVKWGPLEYGNLEDVSFLRDVFKRYSPLAVMHFAAYAYVGESVLDPCKYYRNNVIGTLALLDVMREFGTQYIIFSSTCATYGVPSQVPISEACDQKPINPYGHSKLMIEQILRDYSHAYGVSYVSLRYFNAAGADPDGEIGELHEPETHLIPLVIQAGLDSEYTVKVFGNDYPTRDGSAIRDYIHVSDLASAHVKALVYLLTQKKNIEINLGTGRGITVLEVIRMVEKVINHPVTIELSSRREGDPAELVADAAYANDLLDWKPINSDLEKIIITAINWHSAKQK